MNIGLNEKQREAVETTEGPLLVLAGAGAGKTKTITERIVRLSRKGVPPENILAVTFTNKAAREMLERVEKRLEEEGFVRKSDHLGKPTIKTFHSLGLLIVRENARALGLTKNVSVLDESDALTSVKNALSAEGLDPKQFEPRRIRNLISREKGNFVKLDEFERKAEGYVPKIVARVWRRYDNDLRVKQALDFDDLILRAVTLLKENQGLRDHYQKRFRYIHVDEYQDTNEAQYEFTKILAGEHKNLCVVGDTDQNIYSWRGANLKNILNFERDYPGAKVVVLEENYRSSGNVLRAANEVIKKNLIRKEKNLFTRQGAGEKISVLPCYDEEIEALCVAGKIKDLIARDVEAEEIAVLYRANFQSRVMEEALVRENIPYQLLGVRFFERKEVRDVLSYLRAALNSDNSFDIARAVSSPPRGIGKSTLAKIVSKKTEGLSEKTRRAVDEFFSFLEKIKVAAGTEKLSSVISFIVKRSGIEKLYKTSGTEDDLERLENIYELVSVAKMYDALPPGEAIEKFLEEVSLLSDQDELKENKKGVRLMTVHASKGLEFKHVFVTGLEQDLFPHRRLESRPEHKEAEEEERRLFYVALTRAKEKLYLSYAELRTIFGMKQINVPSEFLCDIPDEIIEIEDTSAAAEKRNVIYLD